jgi:arsenical pump membrane protein
VLPALGGVAVVVTGALSASGSRDVLGRAAPVLVFLVAVTALAGIADAAGVFEVAAARAARAGRGRTPLLFALVVVLATVTTVLLSLDTTAVLLTPVVLALARRLGLPPLPFAVVTVWLANSASLLLPVSNLTNLLAADRLDLPALDYARLVGPAALLAVVVPVAVTVVADRRSLRGRYGVPSLPDVPDRALFRLASGAVGVLAVALAAGLPPAPTTSALALLLVGACLWRRPAVLRRDLVPWTLVPLVLGMLLLAAAAGPHGLDRLLRDGLGTAPGTLRTAATGAVLANGVNNLPAFLALERVVPDRLLPALLLGVDVGPLVLPWASLATLLWADRCRAAGVVVPWRTFVLRGLVVVPLTLLGCAALL